MEKPLAAAAGLGWQGKHTNLVSRDFGSWLFLGSIFTTLDLPVDAPEDDHCGNCRACLDACPTGALDAPYRIDARLCISYLTIEAKGQIPRDLREKIGNRIYGCDDCLAVCPWNKFAQGAREAKLQARADLVCSAAGRTGGAGRGDVSREIRRRAGQAHRLCALPAQCACSPSAIPAMSRWPRWRRRGWRMSSALVRGMAVWALARLLSREKFLTSRGGAEGIGKRS